MTLIWKKPEEFLPHVSEQSSESPDVLMMSLVAVYLSRQGGERARSALANCRVILSTTCHFLQEVHNRGE